MFESKKLFCPKGINQPKCDSIRNRRGTKCAEQDFESVIVVELLLVHRVLVGFVRDAFSPGKSSRSRETTQRVQTHNEGWHERAGPCPPPQKKKVLVFIFPRKRTKFGPDSQGGSSPFHLPVKSLIIACVRILVCRVPGLTHAATGKRARPCRVQRGKVGIKKQRGQGYRTKCECSWHVSELAKIWRSLETWSACLDTRDLSRVFRG